MRPPVLTSAQDYTDHDFYQFERLQEWLGAADVLVFGKNLTTPESTRYCGLENAEKMLF